jgi:hypothetical protein
MGGRYLVTGAQLGILISHIENKQDFEARTQIDEIIDKQHVGSSNESIEFDVKKTTNRLFRKES